MRMAVAAKAIETKASFGHTRFIEVCVGVACPNRTDHDMPRDQSLNSPPARRWHNRFRHPAHTTSRLRTCRSFDAIADGCVCTTDRSTAEPSSTGWCLLPTGKGLGYAAIRLAFSAPHRTGWSAWKVSPASGSDWAGVFHGRAPPYGGASSAPNGAVIRYRSARTLP
ncbi:hypothetical protein G6L74_27605 [Agrobacterium tumefaciens]|nr:hypothetical protein [Agrobacterium tumefaciens]